MGSSVSVQLPVADFVNTVMNIRAPQKARIASVAERCSPSQGVLCSVELFEVIKNVLVLPLKEKHPQGPKTK